MKKSKQIKQKKATMGKGSKKSSKQTLKSS